MRQEPLHRLPRPHSTPTYPLLESGDLPGDEDWSLAAELVGDDGRDPDDDRLATVKLVRASDD